MTNAALVWLAERRGVLRTIKSRKILRGEPKVRGGKV